MLNELLPALDPDGPGPLPNDSGFLVKALHSPAFLNPGIVLADDFSHCEVVWRDTTTPFWRHSRDVGPETTVTLPLSKDNWQFGVRSIDSEGRKSPVVYPRPVRR